MEAHGPPAEVWVDERVAVRSSPIHGQGLFAAASVAAGEVVVRLGGRLVGTAELEAMIEAAGDDPGADYVDTVQIEDGVHLVLPPGTVAHYGNHSCEPTLWFDGPVVLRARGDIDAGEELTVDYATCSGPGLVLDCRCGAAGCRRRVVGRQSPPHG